MAISIYSLLCGILQLRHSLGGFGLTSHTSLDIHSQDIGMSKGMESIIEEAIMNNPSKLGYKQTLAIRNVRIAPDAGRIDVMLLPLQGKKRLVLVETKQSAASDAASKVAGQLLMYYAGALNLSTNGLDIIRKFAAEYPEDARRKGWISAQRMCGGLSKLEAWKRLQSPKKSRITPADIDLLIAVDGDPKPSLIDIIDTLNTYHQLGIRIVTVDKGVITAVRRPYQNKLHRAS